MVKKLQLDISELTKKATRLRALMVDAIHHAAVGHVGGPLSQIEVLTALYFRIMNVDPKNPQWEDRDRFILSKGHASISYYAALAERGFFGLDKLHEFDRLNGLLQGHPCMLKTPGVDMSTGSLGQGLSAAIGMLSGAKLKGRNFKTYVLQGDGETQEGQTWEAAMYAGHHKTQNLILIIDYNKLQQTSYVKDMLDLEPLADKFKAFNWNVLECQGNEMADTVETLEAAGDASNDGPVVVISHTLKGYGLSYSAGKVEWHSKLITDELKEQAFEELGVTL